MKNKPYAVVYEDDKIIAVNKASGISVGGERWDEAAQRLDKLVSSGSGIEKLFTVHRIDKDTSGLVVFAKDPDTHRAFSLAFERREAEKRYVAVVHGRPSWKEQSCDLPLVPNGNKRHMTIVDKFAGKKSLTLFRLIHSAGNLSVLEILPMTGRIHQIRAHSAAIGFPVVCDPLYGNEKPVFLSSFKRGWRGDPLDEKPLLARLGLHALEVRVDSLCLSAPLARDIASLIRQLEKI